MLNKFKNLDPNTKLLVKTVATLIVINAVAITWNYYSNKRMIAGLDAAE